jgi:transcriptional repressor NrdR
MKCPYCNSDEIRVLDKRNSEDSIRRRRECIKCEKRFTTYEKIDTIPLIVIKKDNTKVPFDIEKLKRGMLLPCQKRPITLHQIEKAAEEIETKLRNAKSIEIPSSKIGELVMQKLKKLDKVAYVRFACVYKDFDDPKDFEKEIKALKK